MILRSNSPSTAPCVVIIAGSVAPFAPSAPFSQNGSMSVGHPIGGTNTTTMYNVTNNTLSDVYVPMSIATKDLSSAHRGQPDHVPEAIPYEATSGPKMGSEGSTERIDRPDGDRDNPNRQSRLVGNRIDVPGEMLDQTVRSGQRKLEKRRQVGTSTNEDVPVLTGIRLLCESFGKLLYELFSKENKNLYWEQCHTVREMVSDLFDARMKIGEPEFKEKCRFGYRAFRDLLTDMRNSTCVPKKGLCREFEFLLFQLGRGYLRPMDKTALLGLGFEFCRQLSREFPIGPTPTECEPITHSSYTGAVVVLSLLIIALIGCAGYFGCRKWRKTGRRQRQRFQTRDAGNDDELSTL